MQAKRNAIKHNYHSKFKITKQQSKHIKIHQTLTANQQ